MAKAPKWMIFAGIGTAALLIYTFTSGPAPVTSRKANNSFKGGVSSKKGEELYRPEDYTVSFPSVNVVPRDAFKPLVAKTSATLTGQIVPLLPNGIPAAFAGGDGNWIYTGNAEVDGVPNALLENTTTEEGVFLRPGERWKSLTLASVAENSIELIGPTGQRRSVRIADESGTEAPVVASGTLPAVVADGRSPLAGQIGVAPNAQASVPAPGDNRANRRGRGNRRNNSNNANSTASAAGQTFGNP